MAYQSTNPYNGKVLQKFDEINDAALEEKLSQASHCFENEWRAKSFAERSAVLARAAAILRERPQEFAELITLEMGKLLPQSLGEVALSAAILDYYAEHAEAFLAPEKIATPRGEAMVESSPIGVLFGVEPWNYPYYQIARFAAPNLMAGNVVMVKHASSVPQCALAGGSTGSGMSTNNSPRKNQLPPSRSIRQVCLPIQPSPALRASARSSTGAESVKAR